MTQRYRAIPLNDGSNDNTGENWSECAVENAQCFAVEDNDPDADWIVETYNTLAEAQSAAASLNA